VKLARLSLAVAAACACTAASAQTYPAKPIRILIGFSPGGPSDILTRLLGAKLTESMGQPFIYDNRAGAGGNIAGELAAKSPADGYTLLMGNNAILAANVTLYRNPGFDPEKDFTHIVLVAAQPNILIVHPSLPVKTTKELIALAKTRPGQLNYASSGAGAAAHLAMELFKSMTGTSMVHVPYKGAAPALFDMIAGQCQVMFATSLSVAPYLKAGRLRPLAVSTPARSPGLPDLPTVSESGVPGFDASTWHGVVGPAGLPPAIAERLNAEINKVLRQPDVRERLGQQGADVLGGTPQQMTAQIRAEVPKWAKVIRDSGAKAD
jgi:tripartite-type tricarboxylate transporter receptor subunit TctC